jgi:hypothetical protein
MKVERGRARRVLGHGSPNDRSPPSQLRGSSEICNPQSEIRGFTGLRGRCRLSLLVPHPGV